MQGKELSEQTADDSVYIGIDVSKDWLDVYIHPTGRRFRLANTKVGHNVLAGRLEARAVAPLGSEAHGRTTRAPPPTGAGQAGNASLTPRPCPAIPMTAIP